MYFDRCGVSPLCSRVKSREANKQIVSIDEKLHGVQ